MDSKKRKKMSNKNRPLSKLEQIKLAAAAQSSKNIAQANVKESRLKVEDIKLNPFQPRKYFDEEKLNALAESIKEHGLIQAVTVAQIGDELILIAGERRLRAHQIAGLEFIEANLLYNITDEKLRELSLIENLQREDLSLIEEANAYKKLGEEYNKSYRDIATISGKSKSTIADIVNLSNFSQECQQLIQDNRLKNTAILNSILKCDNAEHENLILRLIDNDLTHKEIKDKLFLNENFGDVEYSDKLLEDNIRKTKIYPYALPHIEGVDIESKKNKLKIEIDMDIFNIDDSKSIEEYIKEIISNNL